jgi:hypothetical protein
VPAGFDPKKILDDFVTKPVDIIVKKPIANYDKLNY